MFGIVHNWTVALCIIHNVIKRRIIIFLLYSIYLNKRNEINRLVWKRFFFSLFQPTTGPTTTTVTRYVCASHSSVSNDDAADRRKTTTAPSPLIDRLFLFSPWHRYHTGSTHKMDTNTFCIHTHFFFYFFISCSKFVTVKFLS